MLGGQLPRPRSPGSPGRRPKLRVGGHCTCIVVPSSGSSSHVTVRARRQASVAPSHHEAARPRALLVTPNGTTLVIKRIRPGVAPYWAIVGDGVEESDATLEEALLSEVREEIAGDAEINARSTRWRPPRAKS
ncbi:NUDIX domain-containing protein [Streptomyces lavenduligriseus]|uniref:NUDIX domain-containing protein n=1 Tax=Streptomyces lavenduligriseus TaxID=67315 RepID=UPI003557A2B9